ncbi:MAG TPA: hypothetical protein VI643_03835 [Planctomycetota bacterium]|nr:hypothetical protein [Planctomycetota bacterium]
MEKRKVSEEQDRAGRDWNVRPRYRRIKRGVHHEWGQQDDLAPESLRPIQDFLQIRQIARAKTSSGLIIVGQEKSECCFGQVVSAGKGWCHPESGAFIPMDVQPGDYVLCMQYVGELVDYARHNTFYRFLRRHGGLWAKVTLGGKEEELNITAVEPLDEKVLLKYDEEEWSRHMLGGLVMPSPTVKGAMARVAAVGPGALLPSGDRALSGLKVGDHVIADRVAGAIIKIKGAEYRLVQVNALRSSKRDLDVWCVIEESEKKEAAA